MEDGVFRKDGYRVKLEWMDLLCLSVVGGVWGWINNSYKEKVIGKKGGVGLLILGMLKFYFKKSKYYDI